MGKFSTLINIRTYAKAARKGLKDPEGTLNEVTKALALGYLLWWAFWAALVLALFYLLGFTDVLFDVGPLEFFEVLFYIAIALVVIVVSWIVFLWAKLKELAKWLRNRLDKRSAQEADYADVEAIDESSERR